MVVRCASIFRQGGVGASRYVGFGGPSMFWHRCLRREQAPRTQHQTGQFVRTVRLLSQRPGGMEDGYGQCVHRNSTPIPAVQPTRLPLHLLVQGHTNPKAEVAGWGAGLPGCLAASAGSHQRPRQHSNGSGIPSILMNDKCSRPTGKVSNTRLTTRASAFASAQDGPGERGAGLSCPSPPGPH
jgi:hypothetical protein